VTSPESKPLRVVIVEDYKLVRVGLLSVLNNDPDIDVVGEAENGEEGVELIKRLRPNLVLMDLGLPGMDGVEATKQVKAFDAEIKVVVLTSHENEEEVLAALGSGANAYCLKDIPSSRLVEVIKSVHEGAAWLDPTIAAVALNVFSHSGPTFKPQNSTPGKEGSLLSEREREVLRLLVSGKSNAEIAEQLYISVHTVKVQVSNILQKLAVNDRVQAAVKAIKEGIV
jgi:DNA-binding NarL/FixJ family response regulator